MTDLTGIGLIAIVITFRHFYAKELTRDVTA